MSAAATTERTALPRSPSLPTFFDDLDSFAEAPEGVAKLCAFVLDLAVRGKLVEQDENDEPASELRETIRSQRTELAAKHGIKNGQPITAVTDEETPFDLPANWEWIRLGEVGVFFGGGTPSKRNPEYWEGDIPWVSPKDMKRPHIDDAIDHVSQAGVDNSSAKMIPENSLLMVVRGMILSHSFPVAISARELTINPNMKALALALPDMGKFPLHICDGSKARMLENVQRSSHGTCRLSTDDVANFPIPLPPLSQQRRIVSKVDGLMSLCDELESRSQERVRLRERASRSCLDRLVSSRSRRDLSSAWQRLSDHFEVLYDTPETLAHLRQSILQLAVQGKLVPRDPNDEPGSKFLDRIVETRLQRYKAKEIPKPKPLPSLDEVESPFPLPDSWRSTMLGKLCYQVSDGPHHSPQYVSRAEGFPFLSIRNVRIDSFDLTDVKYVSPEDHEKFRERTRPELDDILYTKGGTTGIARVNDLDFEFSVWVHVAVLKIAKKHLYSSIGDLSGQRPEKLGSDTKVSLSHGRVCRLVGSGDSLGLLSTVSQQVQSH